MMKIFIRKNFLKKALIVTSISSLIISSYSFPIMALENPNTTKITINNSYSISDLNKLDYETLIDTIKNSKNINFNDFFTFNKDTLDFYSDGNRFDKLIHSLEESGLSYSSENTKEVCNLIEVIRAGYYLGASNKELNIFNSKNYKLKTSKAINYIINNQNFKLGSNSQNELIGRLGDLIGNSYADYDVINKFSSILNEFKNNFSKDSNQYEKSKAIYSVIKGVNVVIHNNYSNFNKKVDPFLNSLENLCLINPSQINDNNEYLVNNAIYYTGLLSKFKSNPSETQKKLTDAMNLYPYLSYQYIEAAQAIDIHFKNKDFNGNTVDFNQIRENAKNKYLCNTYTFDDGKFIVKAGDKVSIEKIKRMYWASKEVKSQFVRLIQNDSPVDQNHPDDVLTVVIYNSPKEYKLNTKLYGSSTDNGGIYIEQKGTFFTYERTPDESIYTLEELFRHEFTHYLQGRYLVKGMWGQGDFYKNNELTWYDEGTAEFFAGSTRTEGVKPRQSIVSNFKSRNNIMELNQLLHTSYGGWDFYNYGFAFSSYLYNNNPKIFKTICNYIKNSDVNGYKNYINVLSNSSNLNSLYKNYINELVQNEQNINTPLVSDDYTLNHDYKDKNEMVNEINSIINLNNTKFEKHSSQFFDTFTLSGTYKGCTSKGENEDWISMNKQLDNNLKELSSKNWSGYKTLTGYFKNYKVDSNGNYQYDVVIHGILKENSNTVTNNTIKPTDIPLDISINPKSTSSDLVITETENNDSFDSANEIKYSNTTIKGNLSQNDNLDSFYFDVLKKGDITINLKSSNLNNISWLVYDSKNKSKYIMYPNLINNELTKTMNLNPGRYYITVYSFGKNKNNIDYNLNLSGLSLNQKYINEIESNNTYKTAMVVNPNACINGNFSKNDKIDIYKFELDKDTDLNIVFENKNNLGVNWLLFSDKDLSNYIDFAKPNGSNLESNCKLKKGTYYINIYSYDTKEGNYKLTLS